MYQKIIGLGFISFNLVFGVMEMNAENAICQKCQRVREYNDQHPENNYEWYDDYLKDHPEEKLTTEEHQKIEWQDNQEVKK